MTGDRETSGMKQWRVSRRRWLRWCSATATVAAAGCADLSSSDGTAVPPTATSTTTGTLTRTATETETATATLASAPSLAGFTLGERYEYEVATPTQSSTLTWAVTDIGEKAVTVTVTRDTGRRTNETELSARPSALYSEALETPATMVFVGLGRIPVDVVDDRSLTAGDSFTVSGSELDLDRPGPGTDEIAVTVGQRGSVRGLDCRRLTLELLDTTVPLLDACVARGFPFALSATRHETADRDRLELRLTDYEQP